MPDEPGMYAGMSGNADAARNRANFTAPGSKANVGGMSGMFDDSGELQKISEGIKQVNTDLTAMQRLLGSVGSGADSAVKKLKGVFTGTSGGKQTTTPAPVTGGAKPATTMPGTPGGTNTPAKVSFVPGGVSGQALGLAAAGEVGAQFAGQINTGMASMKAGGMGIDLQARTAGAIFGGGQPQGMGGVNTGGYTGISNMSQQDLGTAVAKMQANPYLFASPNSKKQGQINSFLNTSQKLNPLLGAAGAAQFANDITSGPALGMIQRYNGAGTGALLRPGGGSNPLGINNPNQAFSALMKTVTEGKNLTPNQMKAMAGGSGQAAADWASINQNFGAGSQMNLSSSDLLMLRQYAASGGNLSKAEAGVKGSVAGTTLGKTTAQTKVKQNVFEDTVDVQNWENNFKTAILNLTSAEVKAAPIVVSLGVAAAGATAGLLGLGSHVAGLIAIFKGVKGISGGGGGGGGVVGGAGKAIKKVFGKGGGGKVAEAAGAAEGAAAPAEIAGGAEAAGVGAAEGVGAAALAPALVGVGLAWAGIKYGTHHPVLGPAGLGSLNNPKTQALFKGKGLKALPKKNIGLNKKGNISPQLGADVNQWALQNDPSLATALKNSGVTDPTSNAPTPMGDPIWGEMGDPGTGGRTKPHQQSTGSTSTMGLMPDMAKRVKAMQGANPAVKVTSGHRTAQQQANLYAAKGGYQVAKPGHSAHQTGKAADVGPASQFGWIAKNAAKFGLTRPAPKAEPWHLQMGDPAPTASSVTGAQVVSKAESFEGVPYLWGGTTTAGFDCSGFTQAVYAAFGLSIPRTSEDQAGAGTAVNGLSNAQPGDLLLYNYPGDGQASPNHVAIYIGNNQQVAAPEPGGHVEQENVDTSALVGIRRIVGGGAGTAVAAAAAGAASGGGTAAPTITSASTSLMNSFISSISGGPSILGGGGNVGAPTVGGKGAASTSGAASTPSGGAAAGPAGPGAAGIVAAVKGFTKDKNVQIAMLLGSYMESNQGSDPTTNTNGASYGPWQIEPGANNVTIAQAEDVNFGVSLMGPRYTGAVDGEWGANNPKQITQAVAIDAAYHAEGPAVPYTQSQPGNVGPGYALAVSEVGDPTSSPASALALANPSSPTNNPVTMPQGTMSAAVTQRGGGQTPGRITINMPLQVIGLNMQDAQTVATMVTQQIQNQTNLSTVSDN